MGEDVTDQGERRKRISPRFPLPTQPRFHVKPNLQPSSAYMYIYILSRYTRHFIAYPRGLYLLLPYRSPACESRRIYEKSNTN